MVTITFDDIKNHMDDGTLKQWINSELQKDKAKQIAEGLSGEVSLWKDEVEHDNNSNRLSGNHADLHGHHYRVNHFESDINPK